MNNLKQNMINNIIHKETKKIDNNFNKCYDFLIDFINLCSFEIIDNKYFIDNDIYKNNLINSYIHDNIHIIKKNFYTTNLRNVLKSKKLPNQVLKHILKCLNIQFTNIIKSHKKSDGKLTTKSIIVIQL
tara:strand:- start:156 stop:542 length:387 start_codon:yes stop_codon:yes gene_type:complete